MLYVVPTCQVPCPATIIIMIFHTILSCRFFDPITAPARDTERNTRQQNKFYATFLPTLSNMILLSLSFIQPLYLFLSSVCTDSSIPNKIQPTACLLLPWVSLFQPLPRRRHPQELGSLATSVSGWIETVAKLCDGNTVITETALPQHWVMCELYHQRRTVTNHPSHMGNSNRGLRLHQLLNSHITYPTFLLYLHT